MSVGYGLRLVRVLTSCTVPRAVPPSWTMRSAIESVHSSCSARNLSSVRWTPMNCGPFRFQCACFVTRPRSIESASRASRICIATALALLFRSLLVLCRWAPCVWSRRSDGLSGMRCSCLRGGLPNVQHQVALRPDGRARVDCEIPARRRRLLAVEGAYRGEGLLVFLGQTNRLAQVVGPILHPPDLEPALRVRDVLVQPPVHRAGAAAHVL